MFQKYYKKFLSANPDVQHFACHSHHFWPDVTRDAMLEYWDDSAQFVDDKWDYIFSNKLPQCQNMIAAALNVTNAQRIVFAPNTHELLYRIYSTFPAGKKIKILTTDSEFYSFQRQTERWLQDDLIDITRVATEPFDTFEQRFADQAKHTAYDWIFCSQVFFNSGVAIDNLKRFVENLPTEPLITIDGYHGFFAIPTDLQTLEHRIFYLAGSYKYAQGGEGACFAVVPDGNFEPTNTGWFAEFGDLHQRVPGQVAYAKDGQQFAGATMDLSPLYRLHASLLLFQTEHITVAAIHRYIQQCQQHFLTMLDDIQHPDINRANLVNQVGFNAGSPHGHFLTFKLPEHRVKALANLLACHNIKTDFRGDRLRFGFAIYHRPTEYDFTCLKQN